ncbi:MAG: LCP family protein [Actinomycetota bacterium]
MSERKRTTAAGPSTTAPGPLGRWDRIMLVIAGYLTAALSLGAAGAIGLLKFTESQLNRVEVSALSREFSGPVNVLLLGSDTREGLTEEEQQRKGSPEEVSGVRSDTIILINFDPRRNRAVMVHFPRDLRVEIPGHGEDKINAALNLGGPDLVVEAIRKFTGLPIHHYLEVNFNGFRALVEAIGGVDMCVDRPLFDELAELNIPQAGCYTFDGDTALAFVRARNVEGDLIPDFNRIARQQQFIRALLNEFLRPGALVRLPSLLGLAARNLTTDTELAATDLLFLAAKLRGLAEADPTGASNIDLRVVPGLPQTIDEISYVIAVQPETERLFKALRNGTALGNLGTVQAGTPTSPALIGIQVLEAGAGDEQTGLVVDLLRRAGFLVLGTAPAPPEETASVIIYRRGARDLADTVAGFFPELPLREGSTAILRGADVAIVVADDFRGFEG